MLVRTGRQQLQLKDVTDGTASTIMVGEKLLAQGKFHGASCCDDNEPAFRPGWEHEIFRVCNGNPNTAPATDRQRLDGLSNEVQRFGSAHPGGFQVAMGDASIRTINYVIDLPTMRDLCIRNDGQVVGDF